MKNIAHDDCCYDIFDMRHGVRLDFYIIYFQLYKSSQVKPMMLTDANSDVRIILETLLQLFNNFQCYTQIDLRYHQG